MRLRKANATDSRQLFRWRNHPIARKNSFNSKKIKWQVHKTWFEQALKDKQRCIYIALNQGKRIGVVRFSNEGKHYTVGVQVAPQLMGKGWGTKIIRLGTKKFRGSRRKVPIHAFIKHDNLASFWAFFNAGYKINHWSHPLTREAFILTY